jgi:RNA polymerase sigma factor (sigma-70 family)
VTRDRDTSIGGARDAFPHTRQSAIEAARSPDAAIRRLALETLVAAYWKPVYKYLRLKWKGSNEDGKDWTQGFFTSVIERGLIEKYDPVRGTLRTYLRVCADGFVSNERKTSTREKRGGGASMIPLDFESADGEMQSIAVSGGKNPEEIFEAEWARGLFERAVEELRKRLHGSGRDVVFDLFRRYDLEGPTSPAPPTYESLARDSGLSVPQVTNALAAARRELREIVLEKLREITGSEAEYRAEALALLGREPR